MRFDRYTYIQYLNTLTLYSTIGDILRIYRSAYSIERKREKWQLIASASRWATEKRKELLSLSFVSDEEGGFLLSECVLGAQRLLNQLSTQRDPQSLSRPYSSSPPVFSFSFQPFEDENI